MVQVSLNQEINWVNFVLCATIQIVTHCIYFPDGELYGTQNKVYIKNKEAYNIKASKINEDKKIICLRKYCIVDFERRKKEYEKSILMSLNLTDTEFEYLKTLSRKQIMKQKFIEYDGRMIPLSHSQRKEVKELIYGKCKVKPTNAETIMSGIESDVTSPIIDTSAKFKRRAYARRLFMSIIVGGVFAYISYQAKDGYDVADVASMAMYMTSLITTAVTSYSSGEICSRVYKNTFYVSLVNFIDGFFEWDNMEKAV